MTSSFARAVLIGVCLAIVLAVVSVRAADEVRVATGVLVGTTGTRPGVRAFLGIPYAAPPVGALRWTAPGPAAKWSGVRSASAFGNRCIQTNPFPDMIFKSPTESEDCLHLSVWTPAKAATERLPVMVWIHGGGFFSGATDEGRHEGSALASKGVVVVEMNYRLGVLGFMAHPQLTAESRHGASGNYGLLDQVAALHWVRENIAAFGGNPGNVTIFGESAGSFSVSALMVSPLAKDLFHKAIGESGAYLSSGPLPALPLARAETLGSDLAAAVGATSIGILRATAPAELIKTIGQDSTRFAPIVDGYCVTAAPWDTYAAGQQWHVPLLAGWNSAESKVPPTTVAAFIETLRAQFPNDVAAALNAYPAGNDAEASRSAVALASDNFIGYGTWKWIETHASTGAAVYRYLFDQVVPTATGDPAPDEPGAGHATDIEYVFNTLDSRKLAWRKVDRLVADLMGSYWTNFAKTGDPNGTGLPVWPAYKMTGPRQLLRINGISQAEAEQHRNRYELQDKIERERRRP